MLRQAFTDFIFTTNTDGSGKAASYVRALDMLGPILTKHYPKPIVGGSMWHGFSLADIHALHEWICAEMKKGAASPVLADFESPSYWTKNFCSAAVRAYGEFLAAEAFADGILAKVSDETGGKAVAQKAEALIETTAPTDLEAYLNLTTKEGKMKLAAVKVRVNQDIFRKMVLANYGGKCCVTGLSVPDVLRASHISPWAEDEKNRLNPENGLCLSATYDAAFDRHLISFDEHYRLVVSKEIKDHYTDAAAKSYFLDREGQKMMFPTKYHPSQVFLTKHRDLLAE
ncbi:MAG: HNH endonuclease [Kiritimatiellae bacterium]|nr:HNH endonuclease [Kiritimatiellia bacterium]